MRTLLLTISACCAMMQQLYATNSFSTKYLLDSPNEIGRSVFAMAKDEQGFMWIASRTGITRYDGRQFRHYSLTSSQLFGNSDGRQIFVRKDEKGSMWAFTDNGKIYSFNPLSDSFELFYDLGQTQASLLIHDMSVIDNQIWIASSKGIWVIGSDKSKLLVSQQEIGSNAMVRFDERRVLFATKAGVIMVDVVDRVVVGNAICPELNIMSLYFEPTTSKLWLGTFSSGVMVYSSSGKTFSPTASKVALPAAPIRDITPLNAEKMLIGIDGRGVYQVDTQSYQYEIYASSDDNNNVLRSNNVYDILVDNGNVWVGTYTGGVTIFAERRNVEWIKNIPNNDKSPIGSHIYAIHQDRDGDMWYATNMGLSLHRVKSREWHHFLRNENAILTICEDQNGRIWSGGYSTGLYMIDKKNLRVESIAPLGSSNQADCIYASFVDSDKTMWFGCLYSPLTSIDRYGKRTSYDITLVSSITEYDPKHLLVATTNGFYILNKTNGHKKHFYDAPSKSEVGAMSNSFIFAAIRSGNNIWFGTDGGGLSCMDMTTGGVETFSTYQGLPSNFVYTLVRTDQNTLWGSTSNGIFCFDIKQKRHLYNISELPFKEFLFMSSAKFNDGLLAFGGIDGAIIFDPAMVYHKNSDTKLIFTDLKLHYKQVLTSQNPEILPQPIDSVSKIELPHNLNSLSFDFSVIDLYDNNSYFYRYILDGFDTQWRSGDNTNSINYTNLSPGRYNFKLQCYAINDGELIAERQMTICIHEPWWNTLLAKIIYLLTLGCIIYFVWLYYMERLHKKQSRERIEFFVNIAHDIRTPLSLMLAPLNSIESSEQMNDKSRHYLEIAKANGVRLNEIVSQLLEFNKDYLSSGPRRSLDVCNLKEFLRSKIDQFEPYASSRGIELTIELPEDNIYVETNLDKLHRIIDNLLSNAIKYSLDNSQVVVSLAISSKQVVIMIKDFGIGIPQKLQKRIFSRIMRAHNAIGHGRRGSGMGLLFSRSLAKHLGAELTFESRESIGSTFSLTFSSKKLNYLLSDKEVRPELKSRKVMGREASAGMDRLLIVEDNDTMRGFLSDILSSQYHVTALSSAQEALDFLNKNMVDMILSDVMMDGMQGDEMCRKLKENIATCHIYIILLTALDDKQRMIASLECGANDYITKPFDVNELLARIKNALATRRKLQQIYLTNSNLPQISLEPMVGQAREVEGSNLDKDFLAHSIRIVTENIANSDFTITYLCRELAMSRTLVYEKLRALTNQSPSEFIRSTRMMRAKELLISQRYSILEVSMMTGFADVKYFSTLFKRYYNISPGKLLDK